ncbi:MAG: hypothetical protein CO114_02190 [Euryarchaeota archaeon CG_4_9_14_3_um_filter_38_12]|nr:MAG: hypothetical protein CO114_02190 [Euryarchaeota archaeon CG_4_9_14_3_um_filter_38_12]
MINPFQVIFGLLLIFFLPGFTFVKALFPRKEELDEEFGTLYQVVLGIGMSIVIMILVGIVLGSMPLTNSKGQFTSTNILLLLSVTTILLFIIGVFRGSYPLLIDFVRKVKHGKEKRRHI